MDNTDDAPPPPYTERRPLLPSSKPQSTGVHTAIPIYGASFIPIKQSTIQHTREPRDYLTLSILSTIFCCCSIGILAIVKSSRAREANLIGDYEEAHKYSRWALMYNCLAAAFGVITLLIVIAMVLIVYCDSCFTGS